MRSTCPSVCSSVCSLPALWLDVSAGWPAKPAPNGAWCCKRSTGRGQCRTHVQPLDSDSQQSAERGGDLELPQVAYLGRPLASRLHQVEGLAAESGARGP